MCAVSPVSKASARYACCASGESKYSAASNGRVFKVISISSNLRSQFDRALDVAAAQQDYQHVTALGEIHAIARSVIDPHLAYARTRRPDIAKEPTLQARDARRNAASSDLVPQSGEPDVEFFCGLDRCHSATVV